MVWILFPLKRNHNNETEHFLKDFNMLKRMVNIMHLFFYILIYMQTHKIIVKFKSIFAYLSYKLMFIQINNHARVCILLR